MGQMSGSATGTTWRAELQYANAAGMTVFSIRPLIFAPHPSVLQYGE